MADLVHKEVEAIQKFCPDGTRLGNFRFNGIYRPLDLRYTAHFITGGLVILVLYVFIGQARATLIPAVTVPGFLIFTVYCGVLLRFLYQPDYLLMALILSIGLVDDANVVVENIFHHIERGESPLLAYKRHT
ncbi:efflux RND transporter permease subunit [Vibrio lentus]|nr:efflux RND transporter permease subunit [Vibrio lentus]